ncbi:MAG: hypothetical protein ACHQRJ_17775 [Alphaproteobacteria bacterium]
MPRRADGPKPDARIGLLHQLSGKGAPPHVEGYKPVVAEETRRRNQNIKRLEALRLAKEKAKLSKPNSN